MSPNEKHAFKNHATQYMILGDILYKWYFDGFLLHFLELYDQQIAMLDCQDGIYGRHFNDISIVKHLLWMGYYWPTMECDCNEYVKKCVKCQKHAHL